MAVVWKLQVRVTGWKRIAMYLLVGHWTEMAMVDSTKRFKTMKIYMNETWWWMIIITIVKMLLIFIILGKGS